MALAVPAYAQDQTTEAATDTAQTDTQEESASADSDVQAAVETAAAEEAVDAVIEEVGLSPEALEDEVVTEQDLEAEAPGRFHIFKKITRTIQRTITRDPIKKAEYRLEEAHEELLRAKEIAEENPNDESAQGDVRDALDDFERNIEKVEDQAASIREKKADQAGEFLEKIADFQIKQQKVLDALEEKLPEQSYAKVQEARQRSIEHQAQVMTKVAENQQQIADGFNAAFEKQRGSEFRDFKSMEMLERMSEFIPAEMKATIEQAKQGARQRFEVQIQSLPEDARNVGFRRYMQNIAGDPVNQMRTLDNIKSQADLPDEFFASIESAKEKAISKFEERYRRFADPVNREAFLDEFSSGNPDDLRVMQQIRENVPPEIKQEMERKETQSIQRFKENFADDPDAQSRAEKFRELATKMRENPDPATFALIQKLEAELPPDQKAFVAGLQQEAQAGFQERFQADRDTFIKRIQSFDPNSIQQLQQFGGEAPPEFAGFIQQAVNQQIDFTRQQLQNFDDPARFERFKQQIDQNAGIRQSIEARYADFGNVLQSKGGEIQQIQQHIEQGFGQRIEFERQQRTEQGLPDFSQEELSNIKERFLLRPQLGIEQGVEQQFREVQEQQVQRQIQNQFREQAQQQGLQGDDVRKFLEKQGFDQNTQEQLQQSQGQGAFQQFQGAPPELQQKIQQQFQQREQQFQERINQQGSIPQEIQQRIQQQQFQQFNQQNQGQQQPFSSQQQGQQGGQPGFSDRGQPSPTGAEQRFDPNQFAPTERGDARSNEVRSENSGSRIEEQRQDSSRAIEQLRENLKQNSAPGTRINEQPFEDAKRAVEQQAEFQKQQQESAREAQKQSQPQFQQQPQQSQPQSFNQQPSGGSQGSFSPPPPSGGGSASGPGPSSGGGTQPPPPPPSGGGGESSSGPSGPPPGGF